MKYKKPKLFGHETPRSTTERYKKLYPVQEKTEEEKTDERITLERLLKEKDEPDNWPRLSRSNSIKHLRARQIMADTVVNVSVMFHKEKIDKAAGLLMMEVGAKKAIRIVGVFRAMRAWGDLIQLLEQVKGGKIHGAPLMHDWMLIFWHEKYSWQTGRAAGGRKHAHKTKAGVGASQDKHMVESVASTPEPEARNQSQVAMVGTSDKHVVPIRKKMGDNK